MPTVPTVENTVREVRGLGRGWVANARAVGANQGRRKGQGRLYQGRLCQGGAESRRGVSLSLCRPTGPPRPAPGIACQRERRGGEARRGGAAKPLSLSVLAAEARGRADPAWALAAGKARQTGIVT